MPRKPAEPVTTANARLGLRFDGAPIAPAFSSRKRFVRRPRAADLGRSA